MPPEPDYPAAHSMDTEWFAVDACGHVGHFSTAEAGALPDGARGSAEDDVLETLPLVLPPCEPILDRERLLDMPHAWQWRDGPMLVFLDSLDAARDALRRGEARPVRTLGGAAVIFRALPRATWDTAHAAGTCLGCAALHDDDVWGPARQRPERARPAALGIFEYGHRLLENWACGPYGLGRRPARPIKAAQLSAEVRAAAERTRFGFCFADAPWLQPADHLVVFNHDLGVYVSADGRTVRTQGEPETLLDFAQENADRTARFVIDPTPWDPLDAPPPYLGPRTDPP